MTVQLRVQLDELDQIGQIRALDDATAIALQASGLVDVRPERDGRWCITAKGRVGSVVVGELDVTVRSKASPASLLFYLAYAKDPGFRPGEVSAHAGDDLWATVAETLIRTCEQAMRGGVLQGYRTEDDSLHVVRGRIRVSDQLARRPGIPLPLEVRFDEYTVDIAENQILRAAIRQMLRVPRLRDQARRRLAHLDGRLDGVTPAVIRRRQPTWLPTRLNRRYAPALRIAEVVLDNQSSIAVPGRATLAAFVVNMATVFEDFVSTAIKEAFRGEGTTKEQYKVHLGEESTVPMKPDVVQLRGNRPVAVFDAKYKLEDPKGGYPNADVYQMLAYCTALQLPTGWLVYAVGDAGKEPIRVAHTDVQVFQYALDLRDHPVAVLAQIRELVTTAIGTPLSNPVPPVR